MTHRYVGRIALNDRGMRVKITHVIFADQLKTIRVLIGRKIKNDGTLSKHRGYVTYPFTFITEEKS